MSDQSESWFACSEPERPTDAWVRWHYSDCEPCRIKADVLGFMYPEDSHVIWLVGVMSCATDAA